MPSLGAIAPQVCPSSLAYLVVTSSMANENLDSWRTGGQLRWFPPGIPVLELALRPALAMMEALTGGRLPHDQAWLLATVELPAHCLGAPGRVPVSSRSHGYHEGLKQRVGRWALDMESVVLRVPSQLSWLDDNALVNLAHPDRPMLRVLQTTAIDVDPRMRRP